VEPDQDADRALKNRLGIFAYGAALAQNLELLQPATYRLTVDGVPLHVQCRALFVVNSSLADMGLPIGPEYPLDDGRLDLFMLGGTARDLLAAGATALRLPVAASPWTTLPCKQVTIDTDPAPTEPAPTEPEPSAADSAGEAPAGRPIWADGEFIGRTPLTVEVAPGALLLVVPQPQSQPASAQAPEAGSGDAGTQIEPEAPLESAP
jgi:diacylglycerol kinase family enzyme